MDLVKKDLSALDTPIRRRGRPKGTKNPNVSSQAAMPRIDNRPIKELDKYCPGLIQEAIDPDNPNLDPVLPEEQTASELIAADAYELVSPGQAPEVVMAASVKRDVELELENLLVMDNARNARAVLAAGYYRILEMLRRPPENWTQRRDQAFVALAAIKQIEQRNLELLGISSTERDAQYRGLITNLRGEIGKLVEYRESRKVKVATIATVETDDGR